MPKKQKIISKSKKISKRNSKRNSKSKSKKNFNKVNKRNNRKKSRKNLKGGALTSFLTGTKKTPKKKCSKLKCKATKEGDYAFCESHLCINSFCITKYHYNRFGNKFFDYGLHDDEDNDTFCKYCTKLKEEIKCIIAGCETSVTGGQENEIRLKRRNYSGLGSPWHVFKVCENHICKNTKSFEGLHRSGTHDNNHVNDLNIGNNKNYHYCSKCICRNYNTNCFNINKKAEQQNQLREQFIGIRPAGTTELIPAPSSSDDLKKDYIKLYYCIKCASDTSKIDSKALRPYYPKDEIFLPETQFFNEKPVPFNKYERRFILHTLNRMNDFMNSQEGYFKKKKTRRTAARCGFQEDGVKCDRPIEPNSEACNRHMCNFVKHDDTKCNKRFAGTFKEKLTTCKEHRCVTKKNIVTGVNITGYNICINPKRKNNDTCKDTCKDVDVIQKNLEVSKEVFDAHF